MYFGAARKYTPSPLAEGSSVGSIEVLREKVADAFVEGRKEGAPVGNADGIPLGSIEGCNVGSIVSVWEALLLVKRMGSMTEVLIALKLVYVKGLLLGSMKEGWMV